MQAAPQMNMAGASTKPPPPHTSPKNVWVTKLVFRIASSIWSLILIGLSGNAFTQWGSSSIVFFMPPAVFCLIWNGAEAICILVRGGRRGMHPAAIVSIDLLVWLGYVATTIIFGLTDFYAFEYYGGSYGSYYDSYYYDTDDLDYSTVDTIAGINRALLAFGVLEVLTHFGLFVIGCVETNIRNRAPAPIIYYAAPPGMQPVPYQPGVMYPPHQSVVIPNGAAFPAPPPNVMYPPQQGFQPHPQWVPAPGQQQQQQPPQVVPKEGYYTPDMPTGTHSSDVHSVRS